MAVGIDEYKVLKSEDDLKKILSYDEKTGIFMVKNNANVTSHINNMYLIIHIDGVRYQAHRLAWLYVYGKFPNGEIDHINGDESDNRILNLRDVSHAENMKNQRVRSNNTSGVMGVSWHKTNKKWCSLIIVNGQRINLGSFVQFHEAVNARKNAEVLYGFHTNHGRK